MTTIHRSGGFTRGSCDACSRRTVLLYMSGPFRFVCRRCFKKEK